MGADQATSILIQIGGGAFMLGLLYGLQVLMNGFDLDGREEMERMNTARRLIKKEQMAAINRKDIEGIPLFSSDLEVLEKALMKHARTKVVGNSIPKALDQGFIGEIGETIPPGLFEEGYLKLDLLAMTLIEESV